MTETRPAKLITYVLLRREGEAFLVRYAQAPNPARQDQAKWWIPSPELAHGEHPEDAARRVLESLGVQGAEPRLAGVDSFVTRDWHVLFLYTVDVDFKSEPSPGTAYAAGAWFKREALPPASDFAHGNWERELVLRLASG